MNKFKEGDIIIQWGGPIDYAHSEIFEFKRYITKDTFEGNIVGFEVLGEFSLYDNAILYDIVESPLHKIVMKDVK